jgi:hypothetical protein
MKIKGRKEEGEFKVLYKTFYLFEVYTVLLRGCVAAAPASNTVRLWCV